MKKIEMRKDAKKTLDNLLKMSKDQQEYLIGFLTINKVYMEKILQHIKDNEKDNDILQGVYKYAIAYLDTLKRFREEFDKK